MPFAMLLRHLGRPLLASPAYQGGPLVRLQSRLPLSMMRRPVWGQSPPRRGTAALAVIALVLVVLLLSLEGRDRFPGRNFGGNQPLARSAGLSPLCAAQTSELRLSTAADVQRPLQRVPPGHAKIARYRVAPAELAPFVCWEAPIIIGTRCGCACLLGRGRLARPWHSSVRVSRRAVPLAPVFFKGAGAVVVRAV